MRQGNLSYPASGRAGAGLMVAGGLLLVGLAAIASSSSIETFLLAGASGRLAWGPNLFRALLAFHGLLLAGLGGVAWVRSTRRGDGEPGLPHPENRPSEVIGAAAWILLLALCVVGLALRLWRLGEGLWLDEILTLLDFVRQPLGEILTSFPSQNQHMLYSALANISMSILGEGAAALRLPAVLFGVGSIWALFLLGTHTNGIREALLAAALMTFSYHHVWFSQNARGYSGLLFFTLLATWLWVRGTARGGVRDWAGYAIAVCLGLWIHMTMVFVVAAHGFVYLIDLCLTARRPGAGGPPASSWWQPLAAWALAGTVTLQLYALSLPEFLRSALHEKALESSEWTDPTWVVREAVRRLADIGLVGVVLAGGAAVLVVGWSSIFRHDWRTALAMALPGVLGGATMIALGHPLWPRFFFFCMGFVLLAVVRGLMAAPRLLLATAGAPPPARRRFAARLGLALNLLMILASAATLPGAFRPKQDFAGARDFIESRRGESDGVVAVGLAGGVYRRYYAPEWRVVENTEELDTLEKLHRRVWLVYTLPVHVRAWYPELWNSIQTDYEVVRVFGGTLGGGDVIVCRRRQGV